VLELLGRLVTFYFTRDVRDLKAFLPVCSLYLPHTNGTNDSFQAFVQVPLKYVSLL
jgi:hypothetical protein